MQYLFILRNHAAYEIQYQVFGNKQVNNRITASSRTAGGQHEADHVVVLDD